MLLSARNVNLDVERFKSFYHSWQSKILQDLYNQDTREENINLKASFLKQNAQKNNQELFFTLKELDNEAQYKRYYEKLIALLMYQNIDEQAFQKGLEKINEKTEKRKGNGVYYTPDDVSSFIIVNSLGLLSKENKLYKNSQPLINKLNDNFINFSIFDPTCGTGAFVVKSFDIKVEIAQKKYGQLSDEMLLSIVDSLYGNDIDPFSAYISQTRLLFKAISLSKTVNIHSILRILKKNFYNYDFLSNYPLINKKFDFIVGNPPYVEKSKLQNKAIAKYGNIYADVVENSFNLLKKNGVLGYIIPLSYISTPRFAQLRNYIKNNTSKQYILSYADRPDCLFSGVHQKLNILIAKKDKSKKNEVLTSDYNYWYKSQRRSLFDNVDFIKNNYMTEAFYPKLGNELESNIYNKITKNPLSIYSCIGGDNKLYLNMRATFWIKSFIRPPYKSDEYKEFLFDNLNVHLINIILNSSLFWWFWVKVSDCWHITIKELSLFKMPNLLDVDYKRAKSLSLLINNMLEDTKEEVNTKQTLYEYKHRKCKKLIDELDDFLAKIYNLSEQETQYIKKYKEKYRLGIDN